MLPFGLGNVVRLYAGGWMPAATVCVCTEQWLIVVRTGSIYFHRHVCMDKEVG
jgi:hypothetical protein